VTRKGQVTIPKRIADRYRIQPGQDLDWLEAGDAIRVMPQSTSGAQPDRDRRLLLFDRATERQRALDGIAPGLERKATAARRATSSTRVAEAR
jgi:AbrB family looped-hinge helix DNA binding protein